MQKRSKQLRHSKLTRNFIAVVGLAVLCGFISLAQAQAQTTLRKIEVVGLQRLSPDQVIQSTGLKVGHNIDASMIDAALDRLMKSGLFSTVSYRVRTAENDLTLIFEVAENTPRAPTAADVLGQVQWTGNRVLSAQALSAAFGLRAGDPTDRAKIDKATESVRKAYGRQGYITAAILETTTRDASTRRVNYQFNIREGAQYSMGTLIVSGLTPAESQSLKGKWTLAPGSIFNESYLDEFKQNTVRPFVATKTERTGVRSKFDFETKPDVRKQTVNVVINFR